MSERGVAKEPHRALHGLRVLAVDDEPETRELLAFVLEQCGSTVTLAASSQEALQAMRSASFDVLISDIGMPEMDGHALIRLIRDLPWNEGGSIAAVALTGYARGEDRTAALRAGFDMHLTKPVQPSELLVVVGTLVERARRQRS